MLTLDTANSCRICLISIGKLVSIFTKQDDRQLSDIIMEISGVKIETDDNLSKKICEECRLKTLELMAFRQLCIDSDETVRYNIMLAEETEQLDEEFVESTEIKKLNEIDDIEHEECFIEEENEEEEIQINEDEYMEVFVSDEHRDNKLEESIEESSIRENTVVIERVGSRNLTSNTLIFESQDELTQKMREAHFAKENLKKHKCPFCEKTFMFPSKVNRHVLAVHKNTDEPKKVIKKNHHCHICGKAFISQFKVRRHMVVHDTELKTGLQKNWSRNYFLCENCNRKFHTQGTFDRHIIICDMLLKSTIERPPNYDYICVICSATFKIHDEMNEHMKNFHDQHTDHICQLCPDTSGPLNEIIKHGRYHDENVTYRCCVCEKTFPNGDEIIMHLLRHADYKPFACEHEGCGKTFFDKYKLRQHMQKHDPSAVKCYICQFCQRSFAQLDYLNCHIRRKHSQIKPYSCTFCPKHFAFLHDLNLHLSHHTGNKKHICQICEASFTKAWSLKQHLTIHEVNSSNLQCEVCGFLASTKSEMETHLASHNDSYICTECNLELTSEESLKNHMEEAHNQFSFIDPNNSDQDQDPYNLEIP
ncbi:hypothetical protein PVAND_013275 [Polypedilum vanderplanki]|uniref:Zinc finger protein n=1 Tax=Polypedilum vanderplanki TaxID=319348 RepID=A0A9J6CQY0_POLVA|nr:hypothetical protein PVAND_013275 [Polypedilum vanderplanki]